MMDAKVLRYIADVIDAVDGVATKWKGQLTDQNDPQIGKIPVYWFGEVIGEIRDEVSDGDCHNFYPKVGAVQS